MILQRISARAGNENSICQTTSRFMEPAGRTRRPCPILVQNPQKTGIPTETMFLSENIYFQLQITKPQRSIYHESS